MQQKYNKTGPYKTRPYKTGTSKTDHNKTGTGGLLPINHPDSTADRRAVPGMEF